MLSCKKDFLNQPPSTAVAVPKTPEAFQAMLDNEIMLSQFPAAGVQSADEVMYTDSYGDFIANSSDFNLYTWGDKVYGAEETVADWNGPNGQVFIANQVIAGLQQENIAQTDRAAYNRLRGAALFIRAYAVYSLAQLYAPPYNSQEADTAWGVPLHTSSNANEPSVRATLQATYQQIINDLQEATRLLPVAVDQVNRNRPSKPAGYAMLARVYLGMRWYQQAGAAADSCLQLYHELMDYNKLDTTSFLPFTAYNAEILYQSRMRDNNSLAPALLMGNGFIDSTLYRSYEPGDLRPALFFRNTHAGPLIKGSYYGDFNPFTGLAVDEVYLVRAESLAFRGQTDSALYFLNTLLRTRWSEGLFKPLQTSNASTALAWIRTERAKELVLRGQRWTDIRRLNQEGANITLVRFHHTTRYELKPNSLKYTLPIPPQAIRLDPMPQNPR